MYDYNQNSLNNSMKVNGVQTCFKNINRCNLHPQCDPVKGSGDDMTSEDEIGCDDEYRRKKLIPRQATFRCQSPHHNDESVKANLSRGVVWIKAVPQDGIKECWKDQDEDPTPPYLAYGLPGHIQFSKTIVFFTKLHIHSLQLPSFSSLCWSRPLPLQY